MYCVFTSDTREHDRLSGGTEPGNSDEFEIVSKKYALDGSVNGDEVSPDIVKHNPWSMIQGLRPETGLPSV